jgi:hypothetical protein
MAQSGAQFGDRVQSERLMLCPFAGLCFSPGACQLGPRNWRGEATLFGLLLTGPNTPGPLRDSSYLRNHSKPTCLFGKG